MLAKALLENWNLLKYSTNIELREILLDLQTAVAAASLSPLEAYVIHVTYLDTSLPPKRNGKRGRPGGGHSQSAVVSRLQPELNKEANGRRYTVRRDTEYNSVQRDTYWYKTVLNRALAKINTVLNYEELNDVSTQEMRGLHQRYPRRGSIV